MTCNDCIICNNLIGGTPVYDLITARLVVPMSSFCAPNPCIGSRQNLKESRIFVSKNYGSCNFLSMFP